MTSKVLPPTYPSLVDIGQRRTREELVAFINEGSGRECPPTATWSSQHVNGKS